MSYSYKIVKDINKDTWNWYDGCNSIGYGVDWKQRVDADIVARIYGKDKKTAYKYLVPYLENLYETQAEPMGYGEAFINDRYTKFFLPACEKLVEITSQPLYRNDFTIYLTTFPRGPYSYETGEFWLCIFWTNPIANFMHETLHFQFIHYWRNNPDSPVSKMSEDNFGDLKEALTVVLDESLLPTIERPDEGYKSHAELREKLHRHWSRHRDFNLLVEFGTSLFK